MYKKLKIVIFVLAYCIFASRAYSQYIGDFVALNNDLDLLFSKASKAGTLEDKNILRSIWVQGYMDNLKINDLKVDNQSGALYKLTSDRVGANLGLTLMSSKTSLWGVYGGLNSTKFDIKIENNNLVPKLKMDEKEIGIYYGSFGEFANSKFTLAYARQDYDFDLSLDSFKFSADGAKFGLDIELLIQMYQSVYLKPFIQTQGIGIYTENIKDADGDILMKKGISYRDKSAIGLRLADDKSDFNWSIGAYMGYLISGQIEMGELPKSTDTIPVSVDDVVKSSYKDEFMYGANVQIEYIFGIVSVFVGGGIDISKTVQDIRAFGGLRLLFGKEKAKSDDKDKDEDKNAKADENKKAPDEVAAELGAQKTDSLIAQERAVSQKGEENPIEANASPAGNAAQGNNISYSSYPVDNINPDLPVVELNDEELTIRKANEDKLKYTNLIKSFILSVAVFKAGGYELTRESKQEIKALAENIRRYDYTKITVEGHTDSSGNPEQNQQLSVLRARAVFGELFMNGIPLEKMEYIGLGASMPISSNNTAAGRTRNRRVEIFVE
ncbi:MAG: OmpA family protein [Elusimicrobiota bacterium]|nr:OmpA family protein [Elusimicrobiota bacterium]